MFTNDFDLDLGRVADDLLDRHGGPMIGSLLVRLERHRKTGELLTGVRPLQEHPAAALAAFRPPTSWIGLGTISGGWCAPMDGIRPSAHPEARRVTMVVLMDRDGRVEGRIRYPDGSVFREAPSEGAVFDAMRLALGLPRVA